MSVIKLNVDTDFVSALSDEDFKALERAVTAHANQNIQLDETTKESLVERFGLDGKKQLGDIDQGKLENLHPFDVAPLRYYAAPKNKEQEHLFLTTFNDKDLTVKFEQKDLILNQTPFRLSMEHKLLDYAGRDQLVKSNVIGQHIDIVTNRIGLKTVFVRIHEQLFRLKVRSLPHSGFAAASSGDWNSRVLQMPVSVEINSRLLDVDGKPFKYGDAYEVFSMQIDFKIEGDYNQGNRILFLDKPQFTVTTKSGNTLSSEIAQGYMHTLVEPLAFDIDAIWDI